MPKIREKHLAALKEVVQPINLEDTMPEAGRKILVVNTIEMFEQEGELEGKDPVEGIHQMRVASRRLRSAFRVWVNYYAPKVVRPFMRDLRTTARALGEVRDLDVLMGNLSKHQATLAEDQQAAFQPLLDHLATQREKARKKLFDWLDSRDYKHFTRNFTDFLTEAGKGNLKPETELTPFQVRHVAPVIFQQHLANVRVYDTVLPSETPEVLHALRIEIKRLRYILTFFSEVLGTSIGDYIQEVKAIQEHLGNLNDASVGQQNLADDDTPADQAEIIEAYRAQLAAQAETLIASFPEAWANFNKRATQRKLADALLVMR